MEQDGGVRSKGIVKWFDGTKGYGFIEPEDGGDDVFVHRSSVKAEDGFRTLDNDEPVEFVIFEAEDGRHQAFDVTRMSESMPLTSSTRISSQICEERSTVEQDGVRIKGTVKWYDEFKGYGFIIPEDGGDNVFVHRSSIKSESCCQWLADGELVEFVISEAEDGRLQAFNVTKPGGDCINGNKLTGTTRFKATWKWFDYRIPSGISLSSFSNRDEACTPLNNCHVIDLEIDEDNNKNNSVAITSPQAKKEIRDSDCYEIDPIEFTRKLRFSSADDVDVTILADKGEVALRDFPHPRHLCGNYPFNRTRHEIHCSKCFCYLCEVAAPCSNWLFGGHCSVFSK